jgi:hypothetical protein
MEHAEKMPGKKMIKAFQAFSYLPHYLPSSAESDLSAGCPPNTVFNFFCSSA